MYLLADIHADDKKEDLRFLTMISCDDADYFDSFNEAYKDFISFTKEDLFY